MFVLQKALREGLRFGPRLVSAGTQIAKSQTCFGETKTLAASTSLIHVARTYAMMKDEAPSQLDDLSPTMLKKQYVGIHSVERVDDVVRRLLSLDIASQSDKLKIKIQQLVDKVKRSPDDRTSTEVRIAAWTARIQNFKEHVQKSPKDKANKRRMLMAIDRRKKMLKFLRRTRYDAFQHVCTQLGIEYTFPPEYYRRATRRWVAKKAFCLKVYQEVKKQKAAGLVKKKTVRPKARIPLYVFPSAKK
ncbi:small ribosomal subunit protein uS15m [Mixophyes fleayi]|uniref:small ribosomal subunit protein uS15m n=1 Tax=Mixophyes fleayi TaxID=3061075 RepID=UPI003F4D9E8A